MFVGFGVGLTVGFTVAVPPPRATWVDCPCRVVAVAFAIVLGLPALNAVAKQEQMTQVTIRPAQPEPICTGRDCPLNQARKRGHQLVACDRR